LHGASDLDLVSAGPHRSIGTGDETPSPVARARTAAVVAPAPVFGITNDHRLAAVVLPDNVRNTHGLQGLQEDGWSIANAGILAGTFQWGQSISSIAVEASRSLVGDAAAVPAISRARMD